MNDYGQFSIMPITGAIKFKEEERQSWFSHKSETATPYYYKVYLADYNMTTEFTPTDRAAVFRFSFTKGDKAHLVIDAFDKGSYVKVIQEENKVIGYTTRNSKGVPDNFKNFFVITFDQPISAVYTFDEDKLGEAVEMTSNHAGAVISFETSNEEVIEARVAYSFISFEQAERNLNETKGRSFEQVRSAGREIWNEELSKIKVGGGTYDQTATFYSCLYRSLLFQRKFFEFDDNGKVVHYSPYNGKVLPGYMFTDTGFWDTFRALFPFLNLMYPELNSQIQEGLANAYKESGWLPEWASPGLRNIMVGNNSASVVSEAFLKIGDTHKYDIATLYEALIHGANNAGPMKAVGRAGVEQYNSLGYVAHDVTDQSAARTLEYAYDDFAIYKLAQKLGKPKEVQNLYKNRSLNYKNLYDHSTGLMRPKNKDGSFKTPFDPLVWFEGFTEGNSWHYTWSVFHDTAGLIDLMGGRENFNKKLDSVFSQSPSFGKNYAGRVIHEMREMQVAHMGQYAHGNQPIQHMIYLYNHGAEPWKTQYWVRETMERMYNPHPDGYCGDEDNGQTSAWYVFSAMGFYPVTPASDEFTLGAPLFKEMTLSLENGNKIEIKAPKNSNENRYVKSLKVNGKPYSKLYLSLSELMKGAKLEFTMDSKPNTSRKISKSDLPYSLSNE